MPISMLFRKQQPTRFVPKGAELSSEQIWGERFHSGNSFEDLAVNTGIKEKTGIITIDATIDETHTNTVTIATYPVEDGVEMTSHCIKNPQRYRMTGVISDTPLGLSLLNPLAAGIGSISNFNENYKSRSQNSYNDIIELQNLCIPFSIISGLKRYESMLMSEFTVTKDINTANEIRFSCDLVEVIVVKNTIGLIRGSTLEKNAALTEAANEGKTPPVPLDAAKKDFIRNKPFLRNLTESFSPGSLKLK